MVSVLSEGYPSNPSSLTASAVPTFSRRLSFQSLADVLITTSAASCHLVAQEQDISGDETLMHVKIRLDARYYMKQAFASQLLEILRKLDVPTWTFSPQVSPEDMAIHKVSGSLTNAVFFVSSKNVLPPARTILLRVYGPSSGSLISRTRELCILHTISSRYNIGPRIYGTFENGRVEEYFDSMALTASSIRDPQISRWIAVRMAELHSVDITIVDDITGAADDDTHGFEIVTNIKSWLSHAEEVLKLPGVSGSLRREFDLARFKKEWQKYVKWALRRHPTFGRRRVFAHNDAQYGNLLRLNYGPEGIDGHSQIIVVDFEYAAANPAAYDIANHFHEWTANYHSPSPHILTPSCYPTKAERDNFYVSYIKHTAMFAEDKCIDDTSLANLMEDLDEEVKIWGAASHAGWAIWGIIQSREDIEARVDRPEFDYIGYASGRMAAFRKAIQNIGVVL